MKNHISGFGQTDYFSLSQFFSVFLTFHFSCFQKCTYYTVLPHFQIFYIHRFRHDFRHRILSTSYFVLIIPLYIFYMVPLDRLKYHRYLVKIKSSLPEFNWDDWNEGMKYWGENGWTIIPHAPAGLFKTKIADKSERDKIALRYLRKNDIIKP